MNKIYNEDNLIILQKLEENIIDLTITSPPYDQIRDYTGYKFDYLSLGKELFRCTKDGGVACIVIQDGTKNFRKSCSTANWIVEWTKLGWGLFETCIYAKNGKPGAWWNQRFRVDHEYILIFFKGDRPKYFNKESLKIPAKHAGSILHGTQRKTDGSLIPIEKKVQNETKCRGTIWQYNTSNTESDKLKKLHPATFPDKLVDDLIFCFSNENDLICDPFAGSGTTLLRARALNRQFLGMEISEQYYKLILERFK